jgi:hypothetical protein
MERLTYEPDKKSNAITEMVKTSKKKSVFIVVCQSG